MVMIYSLWDFRISSDIIPLFKKEELNSFEKCIEYFDSFFFKAEQSDNRKYLISFRFKFQKMTDSGDIERCIFYDEIMRLNGLFSEIESYCAKRYGVEIINTNFLS